MTTKYNELKSRLKNHDYTYENSDDHRSWRSGTEDEKEIRKMIKAFLVKYPDMEELLMRDIEENYHKYGTDFSKGVKDGI